MLPASLPAPLQPFAVRGPVLEPPCIRQRPFDIAGAATGVESDSPTQLPPVPLPVSLATFVRNGTFLIRDSSCPMMLAPRNS
jgi:hypothetical protein